MFFNILVKITGISVQLLFFIAAVGDDSVGISGIACLIQEKKNKLEDSLSCLVCYSTVILIYMIISKLLKFILQQHKSSSELVCAWSINYICGPTFFVVALSRLKFRHFILKTSVHFFHSQIPEIPLYTILIYPVLWALSQL